MNNLNLEVTDPNGLTYLGNDFANGRSTTGGSADSLNNVEVVLIDSAMVGTWTVNVIDANHGGSRGQPFSLAVMGHGINDLKPDLATVEDGFSIDIAIPSVGQETQLTCVVENSGNIRSDPFDVSFEVDGVVMETQSLELSAVVSVPLFGLGHHKMLAQTPFRLSSTRQIQSLRLWKQIIAKM